ncbi:hypothetical protein V8E36_007451 [Tilletia maclaganii]
MSHAGGGNAGAKRKREADGASGSSSGPHHGEGASKKSRPTEATSKNARRRTMLQQARHIDTGPAPDTKPASQAHASASANPAGSKSAPTALLKMTYQPNPAVLPTHLALTTHIEARSYQLASFQRALLSARSAANTRAWQLLPRHARRRAASHNLLRLPKRMRAKAMAELKASNTLALRRSQVRKRFGDDKPLARARKRTALLLLRAAKSAATTGSRTRSALNSNSTLSLARASKQAALQPSHWLETHLWHAKRFHMSSRSRSHPKHGRDMPPTQRAEAEVHYPFALAYRPHMKGHRAAVRASLQQCTLRDVSWMANVRVRVGIRSEHMPRTDGAEAATGPATATHPDHVRQVRECAARLLRNVGARDGWQQEWTDGSRMCYTTLLGSAPRAEPARSPSAKGKEKAIEHEADADEEDSLRCHALFPINILWVADGHGNAPEVSTVMKKGRTSRQRKRLRERADAEQKSSKAPGTTKRSGFRKDASAAKSASSPAVRVFTAPRATALDEDDMDAMMNGDMDDDEYEDDMDAVMNAGGEDGASMEDRGATGVDQAADEGQSKKRRRQYHRAKSRSETSKQKTASSTSRTEPTSSIDVPKPALAPGSCILLQCHPACLPTLIRKLHQASSTIRLGGTQAQGSRLVVEIQELSVAPSAAVAIGRGRVALSERGMQGNVAALARRAEGSSTTLKKDPSNPLEGDAKAAADVEGGQQGGANALEGYNSFELIGPEAGRVLAAVLQPVLGTVKEKLEALQVLHDPGQHTVRPTGWVLSLDVHDPRLSFPPKLQQGAESVQKPKQTKGAGIPSTTQNETAPSSPQVAFGRLFRSGGTLPRFSKGTIDKRRNKSLLPGTRLKPSADDDVVPVVIVQRSLSGSGSISARQGDASCDGARVKQDTQMQGYTLMVPRGWGAAFFHSLSYPSPTPVKVIGLEQARQQVLESGSGTSFPHDWPHSGHTSSPASVASMCAGSTLFDRWAAALAQAEWEDWAKRPPAKRENWDAKGVRWPFGPGLDLRQDAPSGSMWDRFCHNAVRIAVGNERDADGRSDATRLLRTIIQAEKQDADRDTGATPWLCCLRSLKALEQGVLAQEDVSRSARRLSSAFVPVRIRACRKGLFVQWAEIHLTTSVDEMAKWRAVLKVMGNDRKLGERLADELGPWEPPKPASRTKLAQHRSTHVGTVTSGDYALTQGKSSAVGIIPLVAWLELCAREELLASLDSGTKKGNSSSGDGGTATIATASPSAAPPPPPSTTTTTTTARSTRQPRNAIPREALVFVRDRTSEMYRLASVEAVLL